VALLGVIQSAIVEGDKIHAQDDEISDEHCN
jgi:hypothetical protein